MAYITNADIQVRLGNDAYVQLTDDNNDGAADAAVVDEARLAAEGELDSYLGARYAVPVSLTAHPELSNVVKSAALDLAEYRLRVRRPPVAQDAVRRHNEVKEWLQRVAFGEVELPFSTSPAANAARGLFAAMSSSERLLSRDELALH